jgi:amidophosphoribosyltransferase
MDRLSELSGGKQFCHGCFSGNYPMQPPTEDIRGEHENFKRGDNYNIK